MIPAVNLDIDHTQEQGGTSEEFLWVRRVGAAMLNQAMLDAARHALKRKHSNTFSRQDCYKAWPYVMRDDRNWPMAFAELCAIYGMDPARMRKRVAESPEAVLKARMHSGRPPGGGADA